MLGVDPHEGAWEIMGDRSSSRGDRVLGIDPHEGGAAAARAHFFDETLGLLPDRRHLRSVEIGGDRCGDRSKSREIAGDRCGDCG